MRELPSIDALQTLQTRQRRPYIYKATEDAAWTSTGWTTYASTWRVKVKKVKMNGTLDTIELTKDCIGAETDPLPIASGDYCIETVTADGLRALVRYETGRQLYVAQSDATLAAGVYSVSGKKMLIDGTTPGSAETFTAAKRYVPTIGAVLNAPIRSGEIFTLAAIDGTGASVAVAFDFGEMPRPFDVFAVSSTSVKVYAPIASVLDGDGTAVNVAQKTIEPYTAGTQTITITANENCDLWAKAGGGVYGDLAIVKGTAPALDYWFSTRIKIASLSWSSGVALVTQYHRGLWDSGITSALESEGSNCYVVQSSYWYGLKYMPIKFVDKTFVKTVDFGAETVETETVKVVEYISDP